MPCNPYAYHERRRKAPINHMSLRKTVLLVVPVATLNVLHQLQYQ